MRILHTSDWHIGKQLKKIDFSQDLNYFFEWLVNEIKTQNIDVLLMSGDLFDMSNPSQAAFQQYYAFLKKMLAHNPDCKIIITGGNHDAPLALDAPKELLRMLNVSVVGGITSNIDDMFVKVDKGDESIVVAAVPFLRDRDIRNAAPGESYAEKTELTKVGIQSFFQKINEHYNAHYSQLPYIVMGHLYVQGADVSDSERQIQVGNLAGVDGGIFGNEPHYVALGHIHKPQTAGASHIRYSGSPIPLSFSEKNDTKQVVILEWKNDAFDLEIVKIPSYRKMITLSGTLNEVKNKIAQYTTDSLLKDLVELDITEEVESYEATQQLIALVGDPGNEALEIVNYKITFKEKIDGLATLLGETTEIHTHTPMEIFKKRIENEELLANYNELLQAFAEILDELNENEHF